MISADTIKVHEQIVGQKQKNKTEKSHKNYHYRKNSLARRRNNVKFCNVFSAWYTFLAAVFKEKRENNDHIK